MSYHFKLTLTRVQVLSEQFREPGKDELRLIGYGVSRKGHLFSIGFRNLGSYSTGDDRSTGIFPMTLFEGDLEDDGLDVAAGMWVIEEDTGGVGDESASLDQGFREDFVRRGSELKDLHFPRECIPFTAFFSAMSSFGPRLSSAASDFWNDDDISDPREFLFQFQSLIALSAHGQTSRTFVVHTAGVYNLFFSFSYELIQVILG